jgi:hypothetical protein
MSTLARNANTSLDLNGKTAAVSGGTQGIGAGVAIRFAQAGANVYVIGRNAKLGSQVVEQLKASGHGKTYEFIQADLSCVLLLPFNPFPQFLTFRAFVARSRRSNALLMSSRPSRGVRESTSSFKLRVRLHHLPSFSALSQKLIPTCAGGPPNGSYDLTSTTPPHECVYFLTRGFFPFLPFLADPFLPTTDPTSLSKLSVVSDWHTSSPLPALSKKPGSMSLRPEDRTDPNRISTISSLRMRRRGRRACSAGSWPKVRKTVRSEMLLFLCVCFLSPFLLLSLPMKVETDFCFSTALPSSLPASPCPPHLPRLRLHQRRRLIRSPSPPDPLGRRPRRSSRRPHSPLRQHPDDVR